MENVKIDEKVIIISTKNIGIVKQVGEKLITVFLINDKRYVYVEKNDLNPI